MDPINQHLKVKMLQTKGFLICALTVRNTLNPNGRSWIFFAFAKTSGCCEVMEKNKIC